MLMKRVLITGAGSFVGTNVDKWLRSSENPVFEVDTVDTRDGKWKSVDFSRYNAVFHVAGIAHVDPKPEMAPLYYKVNCDLALEIAEEAKKCGVKQFIYMSSRIVYRVSKSLKGNITSPDTLPSPNDFYGDSKLKAERGLQKLETPDFKISILRPPMIYGEGNKGNLPRLCWLARRIPVFPAWHNKRSMIHVNNLAEFVRQIIIREMNGVFYPQNSELADTVEIVRIFAEECGHKIWITPLLNPLVWLGSLFLPPIPKMFADSYYLPEMSMYPFDYNVIDFKESLKGLEAKRKMR